MFKVEQIDHVALTVKDLNHSLKWYQEILNLEQGFMEGLEGPPFLLYAGNTCINLFPCDIEQPKPAPKHDTIAMRHLAFKLDHDNFIKAKIELKDKGIDFEFYDYGGQMHSIFVQDPDGHLIELVTYEP